MSDYINSYIYKLQCKDLEIKEIYVGSSFRDDRIKGHKYSCNTPHNKKYNIKVYKFIRENGGWDNWEMIEIEKYPCKDKPTLEKRERYWIEKFKSFLNSRIPSQTEEEKKIHQQNINISGMKKIKKKIKREM